MKKIMSILGVMILAACSSDGTSSETQFVENAQNKQIIQDYVDKVIVPTYQLLASRAEDLKSAVETLQTDTTPEKLEAAQVAWVQAREPWEQSEAFLFGPVDTNGFDPALDSWPVNRTDLDTVLSGTDDLTPGYVSNLEPTLKGLHTIEYLLFGENKSRVVGELDGRTLQYLVSTVTELKKIAGQLVDEWTQGDNKFEDVVKTAGSAQNNAYPSLASAAEQMVRAMIEIADEVANGKIADPFVEQDTTLVESQFSFNSIADFSNNIRGIEFVYTGDQATVGLEGVGLNEFVASIDAELDANIQTDIQAAIDAIQAISNPFRDAITNPAQASTIEAAQKAVRKVQTRLTEDVMPLIKG